MYIIKCTALYILLGQLLMGVIFDDYKKDLWVNIVQRDKLLEELKVLQKEYDDIPYKYETPQYTALPLDTNIHVNHKIINNYVGKVYDV